MIRVDSYKLKVLGRNLKEKGFLNTTKEKIIPYLLRPFSRLVKRNKFLIEIRYNVLLNLKDKLFFSKRDPVFYRFDRNELVDNVRKFWFNNDTGKFKLDNEEISRKEIYVYGGPKLEFNCSLCQKSEWLSRVRQKNLFIPHSCSTSESCKRLCSLQGDDLWTHFHQNFDFSLGCDSEISAPKCLYMNFGDDRFFKNYCHTRTRILRRQLAFSCQTDVFEKPFSVNWKDYDFLYLTLSGIKRKFKRPDIPIILYGHDYWGDGELYSWILDWLKPEVLLIPDPTFWKKNIKIPKDTEIVFYPMFESNFFIRPNLTEKKLDLLVVGGTASSIYEPRVLLDKQISELEEYDIEFFHGLGIEMINWERETFKLLNGETVRCLNKWSEFLGSGKYVIFGKTNRPGLDPKHYETLGSGAVPIVPDDPDLEALGLKPFEHYIPLSEVEGNNKRLAYFLDNYDNFRYIAKNAVSWYRSVSDKILFGDFENLIRRITKNKYPKRLI